MSHRATSAPLREPSTRPPRGHMVERVSLRRRRIHPSVRVEVCNVALVSRFYADIGWEVDGDTVCTPGGSFFVEQVESPPRLELALSVPDPLVVDELAFVVEEAGGLL